MKKCDHIDELSDEQRAAVAKFRKDVEKVLPHMKTMGQVAKQVYQEFINAPTWHLAEAPKPPGFEDPPSQQWSVGHAKINYVDHIKTSLDGDQ
jgi:hypothetical protein